MNEAYLKSGRTKESDECITPRYVVEPIVKYLKAKGFKVVWCPFDTPISQYARVLYREGFDVRIGHLSMGLDFFKYDCPEADVIVSNPPYSCKHKILKRLYELNKPFAMLLPSAALQSKQTTKLYMEKGLEYLGFDSRPCFYTKGDFSYIKDSNHFASGYFCRNVLPEKLIFEELKLIQEPYL